MSSSNIFDPWQYLIGSDWQLFKREEDILNVFNKTTQYYQEDDQLNFNQDLINSSVFNDRCNDQTWNEKVSNSPMYWVSQNYEAFADLIESVGATIDNLESFEDQNENWVYYTNRPEEIKNSNENDSQETTPISLPSREITSNFNNTNAAKDSSNLKAVTFLSTSKVVETNEEKQISLNRSQRVKLFSRRKDVIIKTLLRKWRKFFLKDFNSQTNYLKTAKRKYGSSVYKTLLEYYLNRVFVNNQSEDLLIFMAAFLYPQDLEDSIDLFTSPRYDNFTIKTLLAQIHEILYKYSHQKFSGFSKNPEFQILFLRFDEMGSEVHKKDSEYAAGFEIIKDQLQ